MERHRQSASVDEVWSTFSTTAAPQLSQNYDKAIDKMIPILQNMLADTSPTSYTNDKPNRMAYQNCGPVRKAPPPPLSHSQVEKSHSTSNLLSDAKTPPVPRIRSSANQSPIPKRAGSQPNLLETRPPQQPKRRRPPPPPTQLTDKPIVPPRSSGHVDDDYEIYVIPNNPQPHLLKPRKLSSSESKSTNTQHTPASNLISGNSNGYLSIISPQSDLQPQDDSDEEYMTIKSHHPIQIVDEREDDYVSMTSSHQPNQISNEKEEDYVNMIPLHPKLQRKGGNKKRQVTTTALQQGQVDLPTSNSLTTQVNNTPGVNGRIETRQLPALSTNPESYTSMYVDLDSFIQPKKAVHQYVDLDLLSSPDEEEYVEMALPPQKQALTSPPLPPRYDSFITQDDSIYATIPDI